MPRIFAPIIALLFAAAGVAVANPPVDYSLTCDGTVIGAVSVTEDGLHVMLLEGATCDGELALAEDDSIEVSLQLDAEGVPTLTVGDTAAVATSVPQAALDGKLGAQEARSSAFARAALGGDGAGAGAGTAGADDSDVDVDRRPELPAAAGGAGRP